MLTVRPSSSEAVLFADISKTCFLKGFSISGASNDRRIPNRASHLLYRETMDVTTSICTDDIRTEGCKFATLIFRLTKVNEKLPLSSVG